jgi:elongation factor Ts
MSVTSAGSVKELRDRTGAGMMDCKAALESSGGDLEKAIDFLRKKGMASAAKRAGREAKEGLVVSRVSGKKAALVEANCETDFVARTDDFKNLALMALEDVLASGESVLGAEKISNRIAELSGKIGEKILLRRAKLVQAQDGALFTYIHSNNKLGVIVEIAPAGLAANPAFEELGKNIAMQVAASNPIALTRQEVSPALIEREKAVFREEVKGKPENILEKIIQGKLDKFYQSQCLIEQPFIKDDKMSVQTLVNEASKKLGQAIQVKSFTRFQLGETVVS